MLDQSGSQSSSEDVMEETNMSAEQPVRPFHHVDVRPFNRLTARLEVLVRDP